MADLKEVVNSKMFGGKVTFRSDMEEENKDAVTDSPAEATEEVKEEELKVRDSNESVEGNEPQPEN